MSFERGYIFSNSIDYDTLDLTDKEKAELCRKVAARINENIEKMFMEATAGSDLWKNKPALPSCGCSGLFHTCGLMT